ncbi:MAG: Nif3-like dinuclear metal center hexameric protein [Tissierellales bacterium]|nr:Nif3-like dinuclear metal center hexameric protein [Tissierellales bacterium]MBN2826913.1 Nif3-like dinuclear metal center hexameric protein [Tissierellales bacterium]
MKIKEAVAKLEKYMAVVEANRKGKALVVGNEDLDVKGFISTYVVNQDAIKNAELNDANVFLCYGEFESSASCSLATELIKKDMAVISLKTEMDVCANGFEGTLLHALGLEGNRVTDITFSESCYKLVVCVPKLEEDYTSTIRKELGKMGVEDGPQGAGYVGTYSEVSDCTYGHQWFVTMPGSNPFIGNIGDLSKVDVERFEIIIPEHQVDACVDRLWELHPYEEVEYDVYPIMEKRNHKGHGRVGQLKEPLSFEAFNEIIKQTTCSSNLLIAPKCQEVRKVGVCVHLTLCLAKQLIKNNVDTILTSHVDASIVDYLKSQKINLVCINDFNLKSVCISKTEELLSNDVLNITNMTVNPLILI